jgi:hypothetical protein
LLHSLTLSAGVFFVLEARCSSGFHFSSLAQPLLLGYRAHYFVRDGLVFVQH